MAVLLLAHGSPESPRDVPEFMRNITGGRAIPAEVMEEIVHRYTLIGRSPLTEITVRQAELLQSELGLPVYVGMRNWKPFIAETVAKMRADGVERAVAIPLAPQNSRTSVGLYRRAAFAEAGESMQLDFVDAWHDQPLLIRGFAERLLPALNSARAELGTAVPVIFTAHSVPVRTIEDGDPYLEQAHRTAELVAQAAGLLPAQWRFAFQSQGMSGGAWLGPTVEETIESLRAGGAGGVVIETIGFVCDHVEVLYDVDIAFRQFAGERGMRLWRAESLNDSPTFISALASLARERLRSLLPAAEPAGRPAS